ncbi:MAG: hypothetical protein AAF466_14770, partial [Bacteroidota bacterium]
DTNKKIVELADQGLEALVKVDHSDTTHIQGQWKQTLKELNTNTDIRAIERLNQVTDTMLARYAEEFPTYVLQKINTSCFGKHFTDEDFDQKLLYWKRKLISNYGHLSYNRARSFNYVESEQKSTDVFGLPVIVQKISLLLGILHPEQRNLSQIMEHKEFDYEKMMDNAKEYTEKDIKLFKKLYRGMRKLVPYNATDQTNLETIFRLGVVAENYIGVQKKEVKGQIELQFKMNPELTLMSDRSESRIKTAKKYAVTLIKKLNEKTEGIHLLEHLLLAPPASDPHFGYSFDVVLKVHSDGTEDRVQFKHTSPKSSMERNQDLDFIKQGDESRFMPEFIVQKKRHVQSYHIDLVREVEMTKDEAYGTERKIAYELLAKSTDEFSDQAKADEIAATLNSLVTKQKGCPVSNLKYVAYLDDEEVNESFFSFKMSFILPSWPVRFQQESFRIQFNNILYQQVPIHIHYNTHWLTLPEMSEFEKAYFRWLELLRKQDDKPQQMKAALKQVHIIEEFQNKGDAS